MKVDVPGKKYVQTVERLVDWGLTSHQQLRSYGEGASVYSPIRRTGEPATPGLQGEWHNHCTTKASQAVEKRNTAVMKAAKCVNCSGPHPTFSHDCPIWHKEKELLKIKYTKSGLLRSAKNCRTAIVHDKQELRQHHKKCWHTCQTS